MRAKAETGQYLQDTPQKILSDMKQLWKNIVIFNMPSTTEFMDGHKLNLLATDAFKFFEPILAKGSDEYLFDCDDNFLVSRFYEYKNRLFRNYLNLLSRDYKLNEELTIETYFEEKDKRNSSSKERNRIAILAHTKKLKNARIEDLYDEKKLVFDFDSKSMVIEVSGINMIKLDYSEVDHYQATLPLKNFIKSHSQLFKKSVSKTLLDPSQPLVNPDCPAGPQPEAEDPEHRSASAQSLSAADFQLISQLEYWFSEQKNTTDCHMLVAHDMNPISIKIFSLLHAVSPVCLVSGYFPLTSTISDFSAFERSELIMCSVCHEFFYQEYLFKYKLSSSETTRDFVCPGCKGCMKCDKPHFSLLAEDGVFKETGSLR